MALTQVDRNLLRRCLDEEPGAWKDFVDRFIGLFVHIVNHTAHARSVRLSQEDVDDLCAEVFVTLLTGDYAVLRRFRGNSSLATYLTVVARRVIVKEMARRRMAEAMGHVPAHRSSLVEAGAVGPEQLHFEDQDEIQELLKQLPQQDAAIVRQYHLEGRSYGEISSSLGVPENSIGPTLSRARDRMRRSKVRT